MVEIMKIMATSFNRSHAHTAALSAPGPEGGHGQPTPGHSYTLTGKSGSVSCEVTAPFSWVLICTKFCLCLLRVSVSLVLWKKSSDKLRQHIKKQRHYR